MARKGEIKTPGYDGFCRERGLERGPGTAVRFKTPRDGHTIVHDLIRGDVDFANETIDDFVVAKSSGVVLYALANVTDDRNDAITQVIRGEEHLNAPKQMLLWDALNAVSARAGRAAVVRAPAATRERAAKEVVQTQGPRRHQSYRDQGYLASAFVNYLALLGWSPRGDEEIVPLPTMIEQFRLEDVSHSPAFFDVKKMTHMNGEYIRALDRDEFVEACAPWVALATTRGDPSDREPPWRAEQFDEALFARVAPLSKSGSRRWARCPRWWPSSSPSHWSRRAAFAKSHRRGSPGQALLALERRAIRRRRVGRVGVAPGGLEIGEALGLNLRKAQAPIRCAVTGTLVGPPLFESLEVLGKEKSLRRPREALERVTTRLRSLQLVLRIISLV